MPVSVLLMEPDHRLRTTRLLALEAAGFTVRTATDLPAAIAGIADGWADAAVLNLAAPDDEAMAALWQIARHARPIPIIISDGPVKWGGHLTRWLAEAFIHNHPRLRQMARAIIEVLEAGGESPLMSVA